MNVYYNEFDHKKCAALQALMDDGHIRKGDIDDRSIRDVSPSDLKGYERCHFFAGIGLWDYALDLARWPEGHRVWTGSCPCQPWGVAGAVHGRNKAEEDERDLWPIWSELIPPDTTVFGEQVSTKAALRWLDRVADDMEAKGNTLWAADLPAISAGSPQRRYRLFFVAHPNGKGMERQVESQDTSQTGSWGWRGEEDLRVITHSQEFRGNRWPEPLIRSLDDGNTEYMGIIHAAGDAIVPQVAAGFIQSAMEAGC